MRKKLLVIFVSISICFCMSACEKQDTIDSTITSTNSDEPTSSTTNIDSDKSSMTSAESSDIAHIDSKSTGNSSTRSIKSGKSTSTSNNTSNTSSSKKQSANNNEFAAHPGKAHVFEKEDILVFPTALREGYYGKRCIQTRYGDTGGIQESCQIVKKTKTIPKRTGNYSTIDTAFKVEFSDDNPAYATGYGERYKMVDKPHFAILDARTHGAVPTISYDKSKKIITVIVELDHDKNYTYEFDVAEISEYENEGYIVSGEITNNDVVLHVGSLTGGGGV